MRYIMILAASVTASRGYRVKGISRCSRRVLILCVLVSVDDCARLQGSHAVSARVTLHHTGHGEAAERC
ncbi:hypothetical protein IF2G_07138 [Cordyceps javanica]|nr:hypothetical protein IF2G_07138 [Cordyceps javanica]